MGQDKRSEADKAVEKALAYPFIFLGYTIYYFIKGIFILFFEKNKLKIIISISLLIVALADIFILFGIIDNLWINSIIISLPVISLSIIGYSSNNNNKFEKEFKEIGFYTRGENIPKLIYKADKINLIDQKYRIYVFNTLIPISKWIQNKENLENILAEPKKSYTHAINYIKKSGNKKITIYMTYDYKNSYDISPKIKIDWNNNLISKYSDSVITLGVDKLFLNIIKIDIDDKNILIAG
jgi:hypothetical protein